MQDSRYRPVADMPSRHRKELAAARAFLRTPTTDSALALDAASDRLWKHARRTMTPPAPPPCIIIRPEMDLVPVAAGAEDPVPCEQDTFVAIA